MSPAKWEPGRANAIGSAMTRITATLSLLSVAVALTATATTAAQATLTPNDRVAADRSAIVEDAVLYGGPVGALLESDYFRKPRRASGGVSVCRLHLFFSSEPFRFAPSCE